MTDQDRPIRHTARAPRPHLEPFLAAVRNINRLIIHETDPQRLVEQTCLTLTGTLGYHSAWIALFNAECSAAILCASSGLNGGFEEIDARLKRGDFPQCLTDALNQDALFIIEDQSAFCAACALNAQDSGRSCLIRRLASDGKAYGVLVVSLSAALAHDQEEQALFNEVAGDLGLALSKLDATKSLKAKEEELRRLMENSTAGIALHDVILDPSGKPIDYVYMYANEAFEKHSGLSLAAIIGKRVTEVIGCPKAPYLDIYGPVALGARPATFESYFKPLDRHFSISAYQVSPGRFATVFTDISEQKRIEENLRRVIAHNEAIAKAGNVGLWDWDLETNEVYYSPQWKNQIGYADHEIGNSFGEWQDRVHPDDLAETLARINDILESAAGQGELEFRFRHRDGSFRSILVQASVVKNELGKPIRMRGSHVDITQRKAHESEREITISLLHLLGTSNSTAELLRSVTRLMSAWSGCAAVGIRLRNGDDFPYCETRGFPAEFLELENRLCALDHKGEIQRDSSGNPVFECMCGNVICGRFNPQLPFFTDYGSFWTNSTTALLANTTPADRQGATRNRCNGQGYESVALIPLRHGMETLGLLQFNHPQRDMFSKEKISLFERLAANLAIGLAQRRAVENLQASENRFRLFYEQSPGPYQSLDKDGHFIEVNNAWLSALKYERQEVIGAWFGDFLAGDGPALFPERFTRFKETGEAHEIEYEMKQKDGGIITVSFEGRVMRDEAGKFLRTHCVFFDISARKHAEAEKARLEEQYNQSQKLESVGRLAGGVAHDLNNLLTPMLGYSEMLLDELQSNNSCRDTVQEIIRAGERAQELVNQLLAFSRKQTLEVRLVDLNAVISGIKRLLRRTIREDVLFDVLTDRDVLPVLGDTGQLEQVLINLAVNAQEAMPNGGKLTITTGRGEITQAFNDEQIEPQVNTRLAAYVAVTDTGCGMSAELQEHIFEPFFTTKEKGRGTGLGLATVYGIMKQHNGSIKVDSAPGCGTTITCYLPLQESLRSEAKPSANDSADSLRGTETILLVEDDKLVCGMTQMLLERWGYSVVVAHHCREALLRLAEYHGPLHLLLTDVVMPEMNGKELFAEISKTRPELKVLYMSGYSGDILAQHGVLDPGVQFVKKPFKISDLAVKIRKVLERP